MKVYKDGSQVIVEDVPTEPAGRIVNINSAWSCMDQTATEVIVMNARTDQGYRDLIANLVNEAGGAMTISDLRAIIGS